MTPVGGDVCVEVRVGGGERGGLGPNELQVCRVSIFVLWNASGLMWYKRLLISHCGGQGVCRDLSQNALEY